MVQKMQPLSGGWSDPVAARCTTFKTGKAERLKQKHLNFNLEITALRSMTGFGKGFSINKITRLEGAWKIKKKKILKVSQKKLQRDFGCGEQLYSINAFQLVAMIRVINIHIVSLTRQILPV